MFLLDLKFYANNFRVFVVVVVVVVVVVQVVNIMKLCQSSF